MKNIDNLFSTDNEVVEKLKGYAKQLDYKRIFFEHLGPTLNKLFINKKDKVILKHFLEAAQYEYGFFNKKINLQEAFKLYKKYADQRDTLCMYKMHLIYLCEYEKFNVNLNRVLEKIYLLKCFSYFPNYFFDWRLKLFEKIDVVMEIAQVLDLEDNDLEKHKLFFDLLYSQKEKYNLSENDINLMKGVFSCIFLKDNENKEMNLMSFSILNSVTPKGELDYAYYHAKNKCIYFRTELDLESLMTEEEVENFYKEVENKKIYEIYGDYGNYLIEKYDKSNPEIIRLLTISSENGDLFSSFRAYQSLIDFYDFDEIMNDYDKACKIIDFILDEVVFEKLLLGQLVLLIGYLIKYSKFPEKIDEKYLIYVKEIYNYIIQSIKQKEKEPNKYKDEEDFDDFLYAIQGDINYFGFKGIAEQNLPKAVEFFEKASQIAKNTYNKKRDTFFKFTIIKEMHSLKLISDDEFNKAKKELIELYNTDLKLKYQVTDCYVIGMDYEEGITRKKDEYISNLLFKEAANNRFCKIILDWKTKSEIKKLLKNKGSKTDINDSKLKDEICCICYAKKVSKMFIPCKHDFCDLCADKLEQENKCPVCRGEIACIV